MSAIILKQGREKSLLRRHPWIFSGAIHSVDDEPVSGATVDLLSFNRQFLARASYSPNSQIRARAWTFEDEPVDADFFRRRIRSAIYTRQKLNVESQSNACRLIYAESDGIPGLIADRYGDILVLQSLTAGSEFWKEAFADLLLKETGLSTIYERSDADVRELEGLEPKVGFLRGSVSSLQFSIFEHSLNFLVNLQHGHKTGFYLDQRANRVRVRELAKDKDVLDGFCYTGGFTVNALAGGAKSVLSIDSSAAALALCDENRVDTKILICLHSSYCDPAEPWSHSHARVESTQRCFKKLSREQLWTPALRRRSSSIYHKDQTIPSHCISQRGLISKD